MTQLQVLRSVCPLDCPDTCALDITVQGHRMLKLTGHSEHPVTQGFACVKMAKYPLRQHHEDRLRYPLKRVGTKGAGKFQRVSWDEALDEIAERLQGNAQEFGEQSLLPFSYAGTMGLIECEYPTAFFRALGASELDWTICAATAGAGWEANYGPNKMSTPPESVVHSKLVILWGINALRSNSHLVPFMKKAKHAGARVLHIDPYRNETSRFADEHWQVNVGSDAALALALGREILRQGLEDSKYLQQYAVGIEEYRQACEPWTPERAAELCGIEAEKIKELANEIGNEPATFIKIGYGMTRNEGGGNAARAVTLLPALTGAWRHLGGGGALSTSGGFGLNESRYSGKHLLKSGRRHINQNQLGKALNATKDPISTLFVYNSNPAAIAPDSSSVLKGFRREDLFTVVLEHFQTDTADYADFLLPATTFVEHPDLYKSYGHYHLQWAEPIMPPLEECRPNSWVFKELAKRLGLEDEVFTMSTEELATDLLDSSAPQLEGITLEQLKKERSVPLYFAGDFRPYSEGSNFEDRKIRFSPPPEQVEFAVQTSEEFPLRLISPPGAFLLNTSMGNLEPIIKAAGGEPTVIVHPVDAAEQGIADGSQIQIESSKGAIRRKAIVSTDAKKGVVVALGQWWPKLAPDKKSLNELTDQGLTDLGGGSLFGNAVVRILPVAQASSLPVT
ncbi:MAG: molybdopterin-dependent oxidoreductase [Planctomycetota bacterium]|nr:molybdopterin-dependent oxidoreductase [Planctomycetota bacterium]